MIIFGPLPLYTTTGFRLDVRLVSQCTPLPLPGEFLSRSDDVIYSGNQRDENQLEGGGACGTYGRKLT
jgi:hypothetical protein